MSERSLRRERNELRLRPLVLISIALMASCGGSSRSNVSLDISVKNETSLSLNSVEVAWDGPSLVGGILSAGVEKTILDVSPPRSEVAVLTFVEEIGGKPHTNRLDVSQLGRLLPGIYDVTIAIVSLDSLELRVRKREETRAPFPPTPPLNADHAICAPVVSTYTA